MVGYDFLYSQELAENALVQVVISFAGVFSAHVFSSPVITFPMEQRLGVAVQVSCWVVPPHALRFVIQRDKEGRPLDGIQRSLVDTRAEVLLPHLRPGNSGNQREKHG